MASNCIICNNSENNKEYTIKELQLGLDETFLYQLCGNCGSMQIVNIPENLGKYYPNENYYSFNLGLNVRKKADLLRKIKASYLLFGKNPLVGSLLSIGYKMPDYYEWMKNTNTQYDDAILDIGTGNGSLLTKLFQVGYTNLTGIDPFINDSKDYGAIKVLKKDIYEIDQKFDTIMMHHSLEHMTEPIKVLKRIYELLNIDGKLLIRIPIMGNYGWKRFGEFWCGIDAPRHIFIPSEKGMRLLVEKSGFVVEKFIYDSGDYVIWSSEQYTKGMYLHHPNSHMINQEKSNYSKEDIKRMRKEIAKENKNNNGDTAAIYLRKA
ncbi:MAG: class I SAM-dependent methyltransferase [Chitinophagales bacterium]|nr:class I SAM-dependent methyltransferase [Chitinophagales bacterium]